MSKGMARVGALDFVLVGPFKTGTSWMDIYLRDHANVVLPAEVKETFFFSDDDLYARGPEWFESLYPPVERSVLRGEVGPSYFRSEVALSRIKAVAPECRVVCSFREPAERLFSHYLHLLQRGEVASDATFIDVLGDRAFLLDSARYSHHLERWQQAFGAERVTVLQYEDLVRNKQELVDRLCAGIGVEPMPVEEKLARRVNESMMPSNPSLTRLAYWASRRLRRSGLHRVANLANNSGIRRVLFRQFTDRPTLTGEERDFVRQALRDDIERLEDVAGREFDWSRADRG